MTSNPTPTGITMLERAEIVADKVERELRAFPPCKGDDTLGILHFWATEQGDFVEAIVYIMRHWRDGKRGDVPEWVFNQLLLLTAPETWRRRRQEWQAPERKAVEDGMIELEETKYLPRENTLEKRERNADVHKHYYGNGQLNLGDF